MPARRVAVIGAGALGLFCARRLAGDGWRVQIHDTPAAPGASAIAAGMLAPASEVVLDGAGPYALLLDARDAWAREVGDARWLHRDGALHVPPRGAAAARLKALQDLGAEAWLAPSPLGGGAAVFTPEDWRLVSAEALAWLASQLEVRDVQRRTDGPLSPAAASPDRLHVDAVVVAAGWGAASWSDLAPEAAFLSPIKGQLLRVPGLRLPPGPVLRPEGAYLVPDAEGLIVGATMEPGISDAEVTPQALETLRAAAAPFVPDVSRRPVVGAAAVRATTPDGLPLVGPSATPGVWWAAGARRNGWLLAPLVAEVLAAHLAGREAGPWGAALAPERFGGMRGA